MKHEQYLVNQNTEIIMQDSRCRALLLAIGPDHDTNIISGVEEAVRANTFDG